MSQLVRDMFVKWPVERSNEIWDNVRKKEVWRRMIKIVVATTLVDAIILIPSVEHVIGKAAYLAGISTAFG